MSLDYALRCTEMLLAFALLQQSAEHLYVPGERRLFLPRTALSLLLLAGVAAPWVCLALLIHALFILQRFDGPYNGGSDRMGLLILSCLCMGHFMPSLRAREAAFGYLALQVLLSYFIAGWVKISNPEWRTGRASRDILLFSAYPASESLRAGAGWPRSVCAASWAVMLFELGLPVALVSSQALVIGLALAASFHFVNACLFGLNRFFWFWLAAYPSLLWLQQRLGAAL
ncbi:MAG: HTTM domain-containing protein [Acidobacteria bacterium]|nr:HTTM domain-containing protein [Acidobacteriota bacterium]